MLRCSWHLQLVLGLAMAPCAMANQLANSPEYQYLLALAMAAFLSPVLALTWLARRKIAKQCKKRGKGAKEDGKRCCFLWCTSKGHAELGAKKTACCDDCTVRIYGWKSAEVRAAKKKAKEERRKKSRCRRLFRQFCFCCISRPIDPMKNVDLRALAVAPRPDSVVDGGTKVGHTQMSLDEKIARAKQKAKEQKGGYKSAQRTIETDSSGNSTVTSDATPFGKKKKKKHHSHKKKKGGKKIAPEA